MLDDYFKENEEATVDECVTFMNASNTTLTILLYNLFYNLIENENSRDLILKELEQ